MHVTFNYPLDVMKPSIQIIGETADYESAKDFLRKEAIKFVRKESGIDRSESENLFVENKETDSLLHGYSLYQSKNDEIEVILKKTKIIPSSFITFFDSREDYAHIHSYFTIVLSSVKKIYNHDPALNNYQKSLQSAMISEIEKYRINDHEDEDSSDDSRTEEYYEDGSFSLSDSDDDDIILTNNQDENCKYPSKKARYN